MDKPAPISMTTSWPLHAAKRGGLPCEAAGSRCHIVKFPPNTVIGLPFAKPLTDAAERVSKYHLNARKEFPMRSINYLAAIALAAGAVSFTPIAFADGDHLNHNEQTMKDSTERAANEADRTVDSAERTADRVADRAGSELDAAADRVERDADRMGEADIAAADDNNNVRDAADESTSDAEGIRDVLAQVPQAAFTRNGLDDVVERFVDADRNRIGEFIKAHDGDFEDLNAQVKMLQTAWKDKYGTDFDMDEEVVFDNSFASIIQSEEGAVSASNTEHAEDIAENVDQPGSEAADANRNDPGRNIATVTLSSANDSTQTRLDLIHEFPGMWKIDVPDTIDGQKLHDNLLAALREIDSMKDQWPADENQAYRAVSQKILEAVVDTGAQ